MPREQQNEKQRAGPQRGRENKDRNKTGQVRNHTKSAKHTQKKTRHRSRDTKHKKNQDRTKLTGKNTTGAPSALLLTVNLTEGYRRTKYAKNSTIPMN